MPSNTSVTALLVLVGLLAVGFLVGVVQAGEPDEPRETTRRALLGAALATLLLLGGSAMLAMADMLVRMDRVPPPLMLFLGACALVTTVVALSPLGTRLAHGLSLATLIGFQAFRLPLELLLHHLYGEGAIPVAMTWAGWNFDIVTGVTALVLGITLIRRPALPRGLLLAWNVLGTALLFTIVTIAFLSAPTPLQRIFGDPPLTIVTGWPWIWLPAFLVQAALFGHLLVFKRLLGNR